MFKNKKFKRFVSSILIASLISVIPGQLFAQNSTENQSIKEILAQPKHDITFIKGGFDDLNDLEYTYTSNFKKYKAVEKTSPDLKHVESEIYEEKTNGEFELIAELTVEVEGDVVETTITPANKETPTVDTFVKPDISEAKSFEIVNEPVGSIANQNSASISANNLPVSDWYHYGNFFYSTKIVKYTVAAVAAIIAGIVGSSSLGPAAAAWIGSSTALIAYIIDDQIEDIWYTDKVYYKTVIPPDPDMFRMKVAEKTTHTFYSDSGRTQHMQGSPIESEFWLEGYR